MSVTAPTDTAAVPGHVVVAERGWATAGACLQLLGGVLLFLSVFLPWLVLGVGISITGDKLGNAGAIVASNTIFIVVGTAAVLVACIVLANANAPAVLGQFGLLAGVVALIAAVLRYDAVQNQVAVAKTLVGSSAGVGFGWWVCFVAGLLIWAGGLTARAGIRTGSWRA